MKYKVGDILCIKKVYDRQQGAGPPTKDDIWYTVYGIMSVHGGTHKDTAYYYRVAKVAQEYDKKWVGSFELVRTEDFQQRIAHEKLIENDLGFLAVYGSPLTVIQNFLNVKAKIHLEEREQEARKELEEARAIIDAVAEFKKKILE